jgi:peptidoglycan DL-endopeptidase LytE
MRKRQIFVLSGLLALCLSLSSISTVLAKQYEVKKGDNLYTISKKFGVSVQEIKQANSLQSNALKLKQVLYLPENNTSTPAVLSKSKPVAKAKPAAFYTVKKGDNLALIARKTGVPLTQITALNKINPKSLRAGQKLVLAKAPLTREPETVDEESSIVEEEEELAEVGIIADAEAKKQYDAKLLGKWSNTDERKLLVRVATGFLGAPYRLGGSTVKGIDCSAFVRKIYNFFDIALPRTAREQSNVGLSIDKGELAEGDLVFFRTRRQFGHVGIYIGNNEFVHASSRNRVVRIDSLDTPYFHKRFVRAVRVKELAETGA